MQGSQVESEHKEISRLNPWIHALCVLHAANEQPRAHERDKRQRNLGQDQKIAEPVALPAHAAAAAASTDF